MKTLVPAVLIALALGLAIGFLLTPKKDNFYKDQLKQKDKQHAHSLDSLARLYEGAMEEVALAHEETQVAVAEKEKANRVTQLTIKRYETAQTAPIKRHTVPQYDSLVTSYRARR